MYGVNNGYCHPQQACLPHKIFSLVLVTNSLQDIAPAMMRSPTCLADAQTRIIANATNDRKLFTIHCELRFDPVETRVICKMFSTVFQAQLIPSKAYVATAGPAMLRSF